MARLIDPFYPNDGILLFTADHGNADEMFVEKDGKRISKTSHSLNPVPFVIHDSQDSGEYQIKENIEGGLANVAATVFNLMGYRAPEDYEPSLLSITREPVRRTLYKGRVVNLGLESIVLPNDELMALEMVRHPGGAVILAIDDDENLCLIKQFRHAADGWIWELPAGILEPGEQPQLAAIRELREETGCEAETWDVLGDMFTSPGFCDEKLYTFLARNISTGESSPDHDEFIEVHWLPLAKVETMIAEGTLNDAKSIVAIHQMGLLLAENRNGSVK
jgi:ADP-ribose pyrophosphatase